MSLNSIYLRRRSAAIVESRGQRTPKTVLITICKNVEPFGYVLSPELMNALLRAGQSAAVEFHDELISCLKEMKGVRDYSPVYPNFPAQVMEASEAELYWNAAIQYFHDWVADLTDNQTIRWSPTYEKLPRAPLADDVKRTVIRLGTRTDFEQMMTSAMSTNTSASETDKEDVRWFLEKGSGFHCLPPNIPHKEMLAFVGSIAVVNGIGLPNHFKTATDVLRLAVAMSGGDVSLAEPGKFKSFKRRERRVLLMLLEQCKGNITEDMLLHKGLWVRLGERLHPGERKELTRANGAFAVLRNDIPFATFNGKVEKAIIGKDVVAAVALLTDRPGMFARRLDQLIRLDVKKATKTVSAFGKVAADVSTPVLLQAMTHFDNRIDSAGGLRVFFPKGNAAKVQAVENKLPDIGDVGLSIVETCRKALLQRFSELPPLGACKIDPVLKDCLVPFSQRSASKSLRTLVRGSHLPFGTGGDTVRFFIWWKQKENDRTDLDLSAAFFGDDWQHKGTIAYYNLRNESYQACHSGDRTSAPDGACEFIDLDIPSCLKHGGRYVVMSVKSFTNQKFADLPECLAGWMVRQHPKSGEVFDPLTVQDRLDVASATTSVVPMILDLQERKTIWADIGVTVNSGRRNNVAGNLTTIGLIGKAFTEIRKPTLYDLFSLHVEARGRIAVRGKVDKTFGLEDAFAVEKIASEYLR